MKNVYQVYRVSVASNHLKSLACPMQMMTEREKKGKFVPVQDGELSLWIVEVGRNSNDQVGDSRSKVRKGCVRAEMKGLGRKNWLSIFSIPVRGEAADDDKSKYYRFSSIYLLHLMAHSLTQWAAATHSPIQHASE